MAKTPSGLDRCAPRRPFDEYIIRMYKGIFAFAYADDRLIDFWEGSDINPFIVYETPKNCPPMCRIGSTGQLQQPVYRYARADPVSGIP